MEGGGKDGCGRRCSCPFILNIVEGWADKSAGLSHPLILNIVEGWADGMSRLYRRRLPFTFLTQVAVQGRSW